MVDQVTIGILTWTFPLCVVCFKNAFKFPKKPERPECIAFTKYLNKVYRINGNLSTFFDFF